MDSQMFVGGTGSVTIWYPRKGQPGQYSTTERKKWTKADEGVMRLLGGDKQADPVLLELFRYNGNETLHQLAIYGLARIDDKSADAVAALKSVRADDEAAQAIVREGSRHQPVEIPIFVGTPAQGQ
jgi:hypothetical protein